MTPTPDYQALIAEARAVVDRHGIRQSTLLIDRLADALEAALSAHPTEETEWEYRRVTPAGNPRRDAIFDSPPALDDGWTMERRAVGRWESVPEGSEQ